jgi:Arc/MetJ-type ribon-helix-helix transcriptional regulator
LKPTTIRLSEADRKVIRKLRKHLGHKDMSEIIRDALRILLRVIEAQTWEIK